jgi:hypothetical protein
MRWWYDELSQTYRADAGKDSNNARSGEGSDMQSLRARPALTALLQVGNIGVGASIRNVKEALQRKSDKRILNVCMYVGAISGREGGSSCAGVTALVECYENDLVPILQVRPPAAPLAQQHGEHGPG